MDLHRVLLFLNECRLRGERSVLVTVCGVEGSSMRNPGTIMGVAEDGSFEGSLSGGCIENAVVSEALDALREGVTRLVRFGVGSPYLDIKLPCGGGLDVHFQPLVDSDLAAACLGTIRGRSPFSIALGPDGPQHIPEWRASQFDNDTQTGIFGHWPAAMIEIIGHGAVVEALNSLARTMHFGSRVLTPDDRIVESLSEQMMAAEKIERTSQTELLRSDPWTAIVFLFHDHDWEIDLMERALELPHFYLGAMGGRQAHAFRSEALAARGVSEDQLAKIHAPIGLFHSSRDPQTLALSALAEITRAYHRADFAKTDG